MLSWCSVGGQTEAMCGWGNTPAALVEDGIPPREASSSPLPRRPWPHLAASAARVCLRGNRV